MVFCPLVYKPLLKSFAGEESHLQERREGSEFFSLGLVQETFFKEKKEKIKRSRREIASSTRIEFLLSLLISLIVLLKWVMIRFYLFSP